MQRIRTSDFIVDPVGAVDSARHGPVLIADRDGSAMLLVSLRDLGADGGNVRLGVATALYQQDALSLGRSASLAGTSIERFMEHLGSRKIPVFRLATDDLAADLANLDR